MNRNHASARAAYALAALAVVLLAARFSLAATQPSAAPPDPASSKVTVSVSAWDGSTDATIVDGRGRRTGRSAGKVLRQIRGVVYRYAANEAQAKAAIEPGNGQPGDPSEDYDYMHARMRHVFTIASGRGASRGLIDEGHAQLRLTARTAGKLHVSVVGVENGVFRDRDTLSIWVHAGDRGAYTIQWTLAGDSSGVTLTPLASIPTAPRGAPTTRGSR